MPNEKTSLSRRRDSVVFPGISQNSAGPDTADIVHAANAFLSSLTTDQRQKVLVRVR
jgi:hypothetical protein